MTPEPRTQHDYGARQVEAARRVLVDLGQVLGAWFSDSIVVVKPAEDRRREDAYSGPWARRPA